MKHRYAALAGFVSVLLGALALSVPAAAVVTVTGRVEYFDRTANTYRPAKNVFVEVEGDWLALDPTVQTDHNGYYKATQRDPWWGDFDGVDIEVHAKTPGIVEVEPWCWSLYCYHAISKELNNVKGGQTVRIDVKIGGPQNDIYPYYRTADETANAFLVHQQFMEHYDTLRQIGFAKSEIPEVDVIVPAAGVAPYYNHVTRNINLVLKSLAGVTGTGNWTSIPTFNNSLVPFPSFPLTVRHECSHAVHDGICFPDPVGLNIPADHHPEMESSDELALTEGFAAFLPLATIGSPGRFETTPTASTIASGLALNIPTANPPGGHDAWEGEVAGLFWDIYDPTGVEILRHPARRTWDNHEAPEEVAAAQTWTDRLHDPTMGRIRKALNKSVGAWLVVDTIAEFLQAYLSLYPGERHAVKAIAFNRDILTPGAPETQPSIVGPISSAYEGTPLKLRFTLREPDVEDQPFVRVLVFHQPSGQQARLASDVACSGVWVGAERQTELSLSIPPTKNTGDLLWIVVTDDMLPSVNRVELAPTTLQMAPIDRDRIVKVDPSLVTVKPETVEMARDDHPTVISLTRPETVPVNRLSREQADAESAQVEELRRLVEEARAELRNHEDRKKAAMRQARRLRRAAQETDSGVLRPPDGELPRRPMQDVSQPEPPAVREFDEWVTQRAEAAPGASPLPDPAARAMREDSALLARAIGEHQAAGGRAASLVAALRQALNSLLPALRADAVAQELEILVAELDRMLMQLAGDSSVVDTMRRQQRAAETMADQPRVERIDQPEPDVRVTPKRDSPARIERPRR